MSIESLTMLDGYIIAALVSDLRRIAENAEHPATVRETAQIRADALARWIMAVNDALQGQALSVAAEQASQTSSPIAAPPPAKEHDWIPVTGALAETGQFAFKFTDGPLAGLPLSVSVHGPGAVLWLARNASGEMFMRPWSSEGEGDIPRGAIVIGSYRAAALAGAPGGFDWLPVATAS